MAMPVRERRHWVDWANAVNARLRREAEQRSLAQQRVEILGR